MSTATGDYAEHTPRGNGVWVTGDSVSALGALAGLSFDYLCIDLQHGLFDPRRIPDAARVMRASTARLIVRVPWNRPEYIMHALDAGADDVIVPMVDDAAEAEAAVAAAHYPPLGSRSWGPILPERSLSPVDANRAVGVFVMVETARGLENVDRIVATPGLAGVYVGPNDLALGIGEGRRTYRESEVIDGHLSRVAESCTRRGLVAGLHCSDPEMAGHWAARGFGMRTIATDSALLLSAAAGVLSRATGESSSVAGAY
ncbi:HpcH/HpaI aldolase family protein [Microbacterium sp.]|uniref:HpcH/HpaI aldolase family protein n=1 Tax=Microbacterium sp. TaxID=51671 RepID=UPI0039E4B9CB